MNTYQNCLLDTLLNLPPESAAPAETSTYTVAYFDAQGELWSGCEVEATSSAHAWQLVQERHADAHRLHAATTSETVAA